MPIKDPAPSVMVTLAAITAPASPAVIDIAGDADQMEILISNRDGSSSILLRDALSSTQVGTLVAAGGTACLTTSAAVRICNLGGSNVTVNANRIKRP